jgi:hypothetical protein
MSYNSVYYWENFLEKDKENGVKANSYIPNFHIINQNTNESFYKWYSFNNENELLGFIKFIVLPSGYFSRIFGEVNSEIIVTASTYEEALELLNNNNVRVDCNLSNNFEEDYSIIEEIEKEFKLDVVEKFCDSFNSHLDYKGNVFSNIEVYKNIKELGDKLINQYEEDGMIDELERQMEMPKEEMVELFSNLENNTFMLNRISEFLSSKFLL